MVTRSKCISTISYNTESFLVKILDDLIKKHIISDYMYIWHEPEEDERKGHFHVWMRVNKKVDTMDIQDMSKEFDPDHPDKPLKCMDFRPSSTEDWILYSLHDRKYLVYKRESRVHHYTKDEVKCYDRDMFDQYYYEAYHSGKFAEWMQMLEILNNDKVNKADLIHNGQIHWKDAGALLALERLDRTWRDNRANHEFNDEVRDKIVKDVTKNMRKLFADQREASPDPDEDDAE